MANIDLQPDGEQLQGPDGSVSFLKFYRCPVDGTHWTDNWSAICNDRCPTCGIEIEPYRWEDL